MGKATPPKVIEQWSAVTRQITYDYGRASREFINNDDWFHNSENYIYFYHLGLVDPAHAENRRRAGALCRFYMGEDPRCPTTTRPTGASLFGAAARAPFDARFADVHYNIEYGHDLPDFDFEDWHKDEGWRKRCTRSSMKWSCRAISQ